MKGLTRMILHQSLLLRERRTRRYDIYTVLAEGIQPQITRRMIIGTYCMPSGGNPTQEGIVLPGDGD